MDEVVDLWLELTRKPISKVYPSKWISSQYGRFVDAISPYPKITQDMVTRLYIDENPVDKDALTLSDAGVTKPRILEYAALDYIRRYRKHDDYHLPGRVPVDEKA
jgi:NADH dehydrogenase (ubiquinone) 1 alpha subcomplex subunit 9